MYQGSKLSYQGIDDSLGIIKTSGNAKSMGFGVVIGSQWIFSEHIAVELSFNPYYNIPNITGDISTNQISDTYIRNYKNEKEGFQFKRIGLSVGIAF